MASISNASPRVMFTVLHYRSPDYTPDSIGNPFPLLLCGPECILLFPERRSFGCLYQQVLCRMEVGVGRKLMGKAIGLSVPAMHLQLRSTCCFLRMSSASIWQTHRFVFSPYHERTAVSRAVIIHKDCPVG